MSTNTTLLNYISQNVQMGQTTIPQLIASCQDEDFCRALRSQLNEYEQIGAEANRLLNERGQGPDSVGPIAKMSSYVMTEMKTMQDSSVSHMAKMMVQGNTTGETTLLKHLREHDDADHDVIRLGEKLLYTLRHNSEEMKKFL
ncbi:MAG: hypothetical protein HFI38_07930 [Lachnospiraceae bacterium]|jgi:hypothetical protein|nr:hypothetical protein [Lachnospiraceae bacterium]